MAKISRVVGSTSQILELFIQDSSKTDGSGLTGLVFNAAGLTCYYKRNTGAGAVAVSLATIPTIGTFASGGLKEVDAAHMPGVYEFGIPNAALIAGAGSVAVELLGATNMAPVLLEIELTALDNQDAVRAGLSALPDVSAGASGGLPTGNGSGQVTVGTNLDKTGYSITGGVDVTSLDGDSNAATNLAASASAIVPGAVASGTISAFRFTTDLTLTQDDIFKGRSLIFTSGNLRKEACDITGYDGTSKRVSVTQLTGVPVAGDTFVIV